MHIILQACIKIAKLLINFLDIGKKVIQKLTYLNQFTFILHLFIDIWYTLYVKLLIYVCDRLCIVHTTSEVFFSVLSMVLRSGYLKCYLNQASSFKIIAVGSRVSRKLDLYSNHNYAENNLQSLTFAVITFVCICLQC